MIGECDAEQASSYQVSPQKSSRHHRTAEQQLAVLLEHLDDLAGDLTAGAVAVITDERIRDRRLPLLHDE